MKHKLLRLVDKFFLNMLRLHYVVPSVEWSFCNMRKLGFDPKLIIDIGAFDGAFDGGWAALARARPSAGRGADAEREGIQRVRGGNFGC